MLWFAVAITLVATLGWRRAGTSGNWKTVSLGGRFGILQRHRFKPPP